MVMCLVSPHTRDDTTKRWPRNDGTFKMTIVLSSLLREISSLRVRKIAQNGLSGLCRKNYSERASFVMVTTDARRNAPQDSSRDSYQRFPAEFR